MKNNKQLQEQATAAFAQLVEIIRKLRSPGGCPWDQEQTASTLKPFIIEEAYEVIDAIDSKDDDAISEELGDLLLQVMLQSQIAAEKGAFDIADVVKGLSKKMIHRHPHVFKSTKVKDSDEVLKNWEQLKKKEKTRRSLFDGIPSQLPGLLKAARMGEKASRVGFDWPKAQMVRDKITEELAELDEAVEHGDPGHIKHELGDLLFAVAQWARHLDQPPEEAMRACCTRFSQRFSKVEATVKANGQEISDCNLKTLEAIWQEIKKDES